MQQEIGCGSQPKALLHQDHIRPCSTPAEQGDRREAPAELFQVQPVAVLFGLSAADLSRKILETDRQLGRVSHMWVAFGGMLSGWRRSLGFGC